MIVTVKVLGLRARDAGTVAAAALRIVDYVQGGAPSPTVETAAYYSRERAQGQARGSAASLVGLHGIVSAQHLHRLLMGRHAVTGRPLLPPSGSAGRVERLPAPQT
ncbi:relaxase domain-containing protein, partial [Frankia sp. Cj3]|uniref:relaxase domain-containing protein n=1 Tax=Frankia sp. Cj3 TaxID=2880976 RepID=UPI001EF738F6